VAPGDEVLVRRVAAVLVAEREQSPASPTDRDTEAFPRAVRLLRGAGGDAERFATNALLGGFDQPGAAVVAASRLHADAAGTPGHALRPWRVGIHIAETIMRDEGTETRTAIERATALAGLARPGTTAVAAGALPALGSIRDATIEALEGPRSDTDGAVLLIVPRAPGPFVQRRQLMLMMAGLALGGASVAAWIAKHRLQAGELPHVTLGVGSFRSSRTDPEHVWIGEALRTGLNTQLSELSGVKVYSQAFLDFLMSHQQLSEIEVANRLGIEKMLSGSVIVEGDFVRVEAQIIEVASGFVEGAYSTVGREKDFLALENDVVLGVISRLQLPLSPDDERRLAARRAANPDAFRRFFDAEAPGGLPAPSPTPGETKERGPSSFLFGPRVAYANDVGAEVSALLEEYRQAIEARDVAVLGAMYMTFLPEQRAALDRYFASVRDLKVRIDDMEVAVAGDDGVVSYTRIDDFVDVPTRRPQHMSLRVTRTLRRVNGRWRFASVQ
jgi:TolB-like protein/ketosteroid isomerase-like protein